MKVVVVIDDKRVFLTRWQNTLLKEKDVKVLLFSHPLEFLQYCESNEDFSGTIDFLITDRKTPGFDTIDSDFIKIFRTNFQSFHGKVFLSTSLYDSDLASLLKCGYNGVIPKKTFSTEQLSALVS